MSQEVTAIDLSSLCLSLSQARDLTLVWEGADRWAQVWGRADLISSVLSDAVYQVALDGTGSAAWPAVDRNSPAP